MSDYANELEVASLAAREAGALILDYYSRGGIAVDTKADASPVTAADRDANAAIVARLSAAFPQDGLLSEETPDDAVRLSKRRVWIIDPLDGTRDFIARTGEFCVHIGLSVDGIATVGAVFHPVSGSLFTAIRGCGAFVHGARHGDGPVALRVSKVAATTDVRIGVSRTHATAALKRCLAETGLGTRTVSMGASVKLMALARGDLEAVINFSASEGEWDTCAPEVIIREAGGVVTDTDGQPFSYNQSVVIHRRGSIASNGLCHRAVVDLVQPYAASGPASDEASTS